MGNLVFEAALGGSTTISGPDTTGSNTITVPNASGSFVLSITTLSASSAVATDSSGALVSVTNTGTGNNVLATSPTLVTPNLGTPSVLVGTNITGTAASLTVGNATNAVNATTATTATNATNATNATTSTNLSGGATGSVPYQSGSGATTFLSAGTNGQVLTLAAGVPTWSTVSGTGDVVGPSSATANAIAIYNGTTGKIIQNSGATISAGVITATSFSGSLTGTASSATNIAGGATGSVPYQSGAGATAFLAAGTNGQVLTLAGGVPTWAAVSGTGTVTSVGGTGTVNGLTLTGTVTTSGNLTLGGTLDLSSPPAIGGTTAAAVTGTTVTATTKLVSPYHDASTSAGGALRNASGVSQLQWGAGGGSNVAIDVSTNLNGTNAQIDISPTGTGHVHMNPTGSGSVQINPTSVGTMDNMTIGATTAAAGSFTNLSITGTTSFDGSQGTSGQVLTSAGTGATPTWTTPTTGTVTSVTGTAPVVSSGGVTPDISMAAATTSVSGYLTSTDWNTFNNKGSGTVTSVAALTLGTTGTDVSSTVANGTTTPVITLQIPTASATNRGALSAADWTTFNSKGSGTVTSVGGTGTVNGLTLTGTVTSSGNLTLGGTLDLSAPPAIGGTTPAAGTFTVAKATEYIENSVAVAASAIDLSLANYFTKTISGTTTFTISNAAASGLVNSFILQLTNGGSATVNWFSGVKWAGGTAPTLTASGYDDLGFFTIDGGTTWQGFVLGKAMA